MPDRDSTRAARRDFSTPRLTSERIVATLSIPPEACGWRSKSRAVSAADEIFIVPVSVLRPSIPAVTASISILTLKLARPTI